MSKHTPGTWYVTQSPRVMSQWGATSDLYGGMVGSRVRAVAAVTVDGAKIGEYYANARLIAAAPELLAVALHSATALRLSGVEANAHSDNPIEWLLHQTEAAIAKATGAGHE